MAETDNVLTKLHDLLLYAVPQLDKFPRSQKFVLGDRIETKLLEVQEHCVRAYYSKDKRTHLLEANLTLETTRQLVRLAHGLHHLSHHTYGVLAEKMDEVGRMIGGWLRSLSGGGGNGSGTTPRGVGAQGLERGHGARTFLSAGGGGGSDTNEADKNVCAPSHKRTIAESERGHSCPPGVRGGQTNHADKNVCAPVNARPSEGQP
jgi:hypothetical protein